MSEHEQRCSRIVVICTISGCCSVVVASAAAETADYSGKSSNFALAQIAMAGRIFKWFTHMSSMANECGSMLKYECECVLV